MKQRSNRKLLMGALPIVAALCWAPQAQAQMMTEQYIPIGQSPGVSGTLSYIGTIHAVDTQEQTVTVEGPQGPRTINTTERTQIWLDRSQQRLPNTKGQLSDCQPGLRVEIKYVDYERKDTADWIKVAPERR